MLEDPGGLSDPPGYFIDDSLPYRRNFSARAQWLLCWQK
tara:strand:+ start:416 stop:532 length:117 start_codon:yes stop_codon:yes gene_type:complete